MSVSALSALLERFTIVAIVAPPPGRALFARRTPFRQLASRHSKTFIDFRSDDASILEKISSVTPDLFCIVSFPSILSRDLLAIPRLGGVNLHPSLLPRHRGPHPLFWTYFHDDDRAGVTVHWIDEGTDTGDIIAQREVPFGNGRPSNEVNADLSRVGVQLLVECVEAIARGTAPRKRQDGSLATFEPLPVGCWKIDFETWPLDRVWRFLRGLSDRETELLLDANGRVILHGEALGWRACEHEFSPGTIVRTSRVLHVYCKGGVIELAPPPLSVLARRSVRSLIKLLRRSR